MRLGWSLRLRSVPKKIGTTSQSADAAPPAPLAALSGGGDGRDATDRDVGARSTSAPLGLSVAAGGPLVFSSGAPALRGVGEAAGGGGSGGDDVTGGGCGADGGDVAIGGG